MRVEAPHPSAGVVAMVASLMRLSQTPVRAPSAPPLLGQHTREVLTGLLGKSEQEVDALHEKGVI